MTRQCQFCGKHDLCRECRAVKERDRQDAYAKAKDRSELDKILEGLSA